MTPRQPSQVSLSLLLPPTSTSDATSPQDVTSRDPDSPPFSPSRKLTGSFNLRNATTCLTLAPNTPPFRKTSSTSTLIPLPNSLRVFKRWNRKASLEAGLRRPSVRSLEAQPLPNVVAEPQAVETETWYDSFDCGAAHQESGVQASSTMLFPSPPNSEDEGYSTENEFQSGLRKPHTRLLSSEDEGYLSDPRHEIDLKHPTRIERRVSSPSVTSNHSVSSRCTICRSELNGTLETYAFPKTAPAVIASVQGLYPRLDTNRNGRSITDWLKTSTGRKSAYVVPQTSPPPTFCLTCFEDIHALHICWTCGLTVDREEERVGYGWAWWHWGCMSCLLCRAPVRPPAWTAASITLSDSPACKSCLRELRELMFMEKEKLTVCRRGFSPPWIPDMGLRLGYERSRTAQTRANNHGGNIHVPGRSRQVSGSGANIIKPSGRGSVTRRQGNWNGRMNWMMRKGEGGIGGDGSRRGSQNYRVGAMKYPPLPKWMERSPGRRSASGGFKRFGECADGTSPYMKGACANLGWRALSIIFIAGDPGTRNYAFRQSSENRMLESYRS